MNRNVEQWTVRKNAVSSKRGVVAAQNWQAAAAGADALACGGNAIDAAIACAFALNVVEPWMCGMGGSGYMVIWLADERRAVAIDFQGVLPAAIDHADYPLDPSVPNAIMGFPGVADNANVVGYGAITVPGAVAGLTAALERHGTLGLDTVLSKAIELAERGLPVDWFTTLQVALEASDLARFPSSAEVFLPVGTPPQPEQFLPLHGLSRTLKTLAEEGPEAFYIGNIGESMATDLAAGGSRITQDDFATYSPAFISPLITRHRNADIYTAGDTSGGPRLNHALDYIDRHLDLSKPFGAHAYATYAHALNDAFTEHARRLGKIETQGCTSHMSAVDADGNMVALTFTLLSRFGSKVVLPGTGILMNNAVSYFDPRPGFPTTMEAGKRINASNMCPTVCIRDGQALFSVGASGANHIVPCTMQLAAFVLDYELTLEEAFNLPRIDAGGRDSIRIDPLLGEDILEVLSQEFNVEVTQNLVFPKLYSCPSGVYRDPVSGHTQGIGDRLNPLAGAAAEGVFEIAEAHTLPITAQA
mgnify:FL=1